MEAPTSDACCSYIQPGNTKNSLIAIVGLFVSAVHGKGGTSVRCCNHRTLASAIFCLGV